MTEDTPHCPWDAADVPLAVECLRRHLLVGVPTLFQTKTGNESVITGKRICAERGRACSNESWETAVSPLLVVSKEPGCPRTRSNRGGA